MSVKSRRTFLSAAVATAAIPAVGVSADRSQRGARTGKSQVAFAAGRQLLVELRGDLRNKAVGAARIEYGVLSDPIEVPGSGTYRVRVTPRETRERSRAIMACPTCGAMGPLFDFVLADAQGRSLARTSLGTSHGVGMHIFARHGVMIQMWSAPS